MVSRVRPPRLNVRADDLLECLTRLASGEANCLRCLGVGYPPHIHFTADALSFRVSMELSTPRILLAGMFGGDSLEDLDSQ